MLYRNGVQRLKRMDQAQGSVLFLNAKPSRAIGRIRWLVDTRVDLLSNDLANFLVLPRWYRNIAEYSGLVLDDGHLDRREEILTKMTSFRIVPCESVLL